MRTCGTMLAFLVSLLCWSGLLHTVSSLSVSRCNPASHICEGRCPPLPAGAELPPADEQSGLCLKHSQTDVCVCWLRNPSPEHHLQTLFKCEMAANNTVKQVMCLPPAICFPPGQEPGCLILLRCPCTESRWRTQFGQWQSVVAFILRSNIPVSASTPVRETSSVAEKPQSDVREFSVKHLLFLLAFVVAPLLCWCLLTFFHEGKCRKKLRGTPEMEVMPTARTEEAEEPQASASPPEQPTAPKFECPPPYREEADPSESCLLAVDCGPPPSYDDAVRDDWQATQYSD